MGIGVAAFVWLARAWFKKSIELPHHVMESDLLSVFLFLVIVFLLAWFALKGRKITSKFGNAQ